MTTEDFILEQTGGVLELINEAPDVDYVLNANEYWALMVYEPNCFQEFPTAGYYENLNPIYNTMDIGIEFSPMETLGTGYYISKHIERRTNSCMGRTIVVKCNDTTKCMIL